MLKANKNSVGVVKVASERAGALQRERTGKNAQILQKSSLFRCDQLIAPVQRRAQRLMSRRCGAASAPRQAESPLDEFVDFDQAMRRKPACDQFDRQRHSIKLATNPGHYLGVGVGDRRSVTRGYGALHEKARGRVSDEFGFALKIPRWDPE